MSKTVVISGSNRGIGLEMAKAFKESGYHVIGLCRKSSAPLKDLDIKVIENIDFSSPETLTCLVSELKGVSIDILINNAGLLLSSSLDNLDYKGIQAQFEVNTLGPLRLTTLLLPLFSKEAKVAIITSRMGSILDNTSGGAYGYRVSKAAVNAIGKSLSIDLKERHISVGLFHPGYVKTQMTNLSGNITPKESAGLLLERINELNLDNTGSFWHSNGELLPW
jgi:NAD(P)-dependent dehydrogenase (short-subunit alcohol dehydrogenase family)